MKTIYLLWNYEEDDPIFASEDRGLVEELMCDYYFDDLYNEYCYNVEYGTFMDVDPYTDARLTIDDFYETSMAILEIPVHK